MAVKFEDVAMKFGDASPEGAVLMLGIRFETQTTDKVYTYAALKAGGRWWFTGTGPTDASWTAVERWLERDGRQLLWIDMMTDRTRVWTREVGSPDDESIMQAEPWPVEYPRD